MVDQFEELFTADGDANTGRGDREGFIAALHAAATVPAGPHKLPAALVVAAVRADFLGRLIAYPPLKAALDAGPFTVGPMSEAELRLAVTGPAAEAGLAVEPAVVEAVIAELREGARGGLGSRAGLATHRPLPLPAGRTLPPAIRRCWLPARRSSAPLITPRAAAPGGGETVSRSSPC